MSENTKCPLCNGKAIKYPRVKDGETFDCGKCGKYFISGSLLAYMQYKDSESLSKISSWISEQNKIYDIDTPELSSSIDTKIEKQREKTIKEKFDCFMKILSTMKNSQQLNINDFNHCYIYDDSELTTFFEQALKKNYILGSISKVLRGYSILMFTKLTFDGLEYIESLSEINKNSKNIFVAFHFTKEMQNIVDNDLKNAIENIGFNCIRVSTSTTNTDIHINDEIIGKIKSSKIVIADFSGHRNSVYFEAGYAMGLNIPVIWSCKKDEFEKLSFDTRQYPHILWDTPEDLTKQIINRIKTIV